MVDLEPQVLDSVRGSLFGAIFRPSNFVYGQSGGGNNWARGFYTEGQEIVGQIMDVIRKEAETCDSLQGFQLAHSLGGGTGSGLGTLLLYKIREEYPDRILSTYSIYPPVKVPDVVVGPYNCTLATHQLVESADEVFCIDNEGLYDVCLRSLKLTKPTYADFNHLISQFMSGSTCSMRFPGELNSDLRKRILNLVPFSRLHFLICGLAPIASRKSLKSQSLTIQEFTSQLFESKNILASCDPQNGRYMAASAHFRGKISSSEVDEQLSLIQNQYSSYFVEWIPNNFHFAMTNIPPKGMNMSGTLAGNTSAIREVFRSIDSQFYYMYARRCFIHWYVNEGVETVEFDEARSNLIDLIQELEMYEQAGNDEPYENEEEL